MQTVKLIAGEEHNGARLDKFLSEGAELSRSYAARLIEDGEVLLNGVAATKSVKLKTGDEVTARIAEAVPPDILPEDISLDVVYEDSQLLVVNKPKGMVVHPAPGNYSGTLVNALLYRCGDSLSGINGVIRPGIVHRIDKDTSGLLIVAKNDSSHAFLARQIAEHSFKRQYKAVLVGNLRNDAGTVNLPIGRSRTDRKKQAIDGINAREAVTHYRVLRRYSGFCSCLFELETGRTHQIRVHAAALGHPVAGDAVYGDAKRAPSLSGQCLHAWLIGFVHPVTHEYMEFTSPLPQYFTDFLNELKD